jgi:DNA-binding NarL/FixJ family response regulator
MKIAIWASEPALGERLARLLADLPDIELAGIATSEEELLALFDGEVHALVANMPAAVQSAQSGAAPPLTARELEVLQLLAEGAANKEIARRLGISAHTVKFHLAAIFAKLGAASRTEALVAAARRGLVLI